MNPEIITGGAAAVGYIAGQLAEQRALNTIERNRASAMVASEGATDNRHKLGGYLRFLAPLALVTGLSSASLAAGFDAGSSGPKEVAADVQTIVDHDYISGTNGVASLEDKVAIAFFDQDHKVMDHLITAHNGTSDPVTPDTLTSDVPDGPSSVEDTADSVLQDGFNSAPNSESNLLKGLKSKSGAEVILIDQYDVIENPIGLENAAKSAGNIPIYFIDFSDTKSPATSVTLSGIANETGGKLWSANQANIGTIVSEMESKIKPHEKINLQSGDTNPTLVIIGAALALTGIRMYFRRKSETAVS